MKSQNASALMRTADAFGIHRIDIYDKNERFNVSAGISKGWRNGLTLTSLIIMMTEE